MVLNADQPSLAPVDSQGSHLHRYLCESDDYISFGIYFAHMQLHGQFLIALKIINVAFHWKAVHIQLLVIVADQEICVTYGKVR